MPKPTRVLSPPFSEQTLRPTRAHALPSPPLGRTANPFFWASAPCRYVWRRRHLQVLVRNVPAELLTDAQQAVANGSANDGTAVGGKRPILRVDAAQRATVAGLDDFTQASEALAKGVEESLFTKAISDVDKVAALRGAGRARSSLLAASLSVRLPHPHRAPARPRRPSRHRAALQATLAHSSTSYDNRSDSLETELAMPHSVLAPNSAMAVCKVCDQQVPKDSLMEHVVSCSALASCHERLREIDSSLKKVTTPLAPPARAASRRAERPPRRPRPLGARRAAHAALTPSPPSPPPHCARAPLAPGRRRRCSRRATSSLRPLLRICARRSTCST